MVLTPLAGSLHLALTLGKTLTISVAEALEAVAAAHPGHVAGQLTIGRRKRQAAGMANAVLTRLKLVVDGYSLIKYETLAAPAA